MTDGGTASGWKGIRSIISSQKKIFTPGSLCVLEYVHRHGSPKMGVLRAYRYSKQIHNVYIILSDNMTTYTYNTWQKCSRESKIETKARKLTLEVLFSIIFPFLKVCCNYELSLILIQHQRYSAIYFLKFNCPMTLRSLVSWFVGCFAVCLVGWLVGFSVIISDKGREVTLFYFYRSTCLLRH